MSVTPLGPLALGAVGAFARALGLCQTAPLIGQPPTGQSVRVSIAALLTLVLTPLWIGTGAGAPASATPNLWRIMAAVAVDLAIGIAIGIALSMPLLAGQSALATLDAWSGGTLPSADAQDGPEPAHTLGCVITILAFLLAGGDRLLVKALGGSLKALPVGSLPSISTLAANVVGLGSAFFQQVAVLAGGLACTLLTAQLAVSWILRPRPILASQVSPAWPLACLALLVATASTWVSLTASWIEPSVRAVMTP